MNLSGAKLSSSVLVDDHAGDDGEDAETSDLAKLLGEKICRKTGLKQMFFSFSVDKITTLEF